MLDKFRDNARSVVFQLVIGIIALVFIFSFGPASNGCGAAAGGAGWAATVNGETVPASAFDFAYRNNFQMRQQMRGGNYTTTDAQADDLRAETLNSLVDLELAAQAAVRQGIWVSDKEVADEIVRQFTDESGRFDRDLYVRSVQFNLGLTPRKYEERMRRQILAQRFFELSLDSLAISDDEVRAEFARSRERASIEYVRFSPALFTEGIEPTAAQVDAVLANRREDLQKRYDETRYKYIQPRGVKAQHIVARIAADATPEQENAARAKIDAAKAELAEGKPFAEVAARHSDNTEVDIGWVEQGRSLFGRVFEEAALKLASGQTSDVVRDRTGFHLIQVTEEREPSEKKLAEVERDVATELAREDAARDKARAAAATALEKLRAGESLASQWPEVQVEQDEHGHAVAKPSMTTPVAKTAESFSVYGGLIPSIGSAPKLTQAVFALHAEQRIPSEVVEDQNAYWVFELKSRERPDFEQFETQKEALRARLRGQRQGELREQISEQLRKKANIKKNPSVLAWDAQARGMAFDPNAF